MSQYTHCRHCDGKGFEPSDNFRICHRCLGAGGKCKTGAPTMKRLLASLAIITLSGCSTIMNDRMTDVQVTSEPSGQHFSITDEDGQRVATGVTPAKVNLDAAAGFFDGQTYQVAYDKGPTVELDSHVTPWYWVGFCISVVSGLMVDPATGDMFSLPDNVNGNY